MSQGITVLAGDLIGSETITPGNTATGISDDLLETTEGLPVKRALISIEGNTIHMQTDPSRPPTAKSGTNVGHSMLAEMSFILEGQKGCRAFKCIDRVSGSAGIVKVSTYA